MFTLSLLQCYLTKIVVLSNVNFDKDLHNYQILLNLALPYKFKKNFKNK